MVSFEEAFFPFVGGETKSREKQWWKKKTTTRKWSREKTEGKKWGKEREGQKEEEEKTGRDDQRICSEGVIKQKEGVQSEPGGDEAGGGAVCKAGNTEQRPGGCLDRCRLPLGSPRSSINRPPHNPALPTVGEICPETHGVALANRVKEGRGEGGREGVGGGRQGRMGTWPLSDPCWIYTQLSLASGPISSRFPHWGPCRTPEASFTALIAMLSQSHIPPSPHMHRSMEAHIQKCTHTVRFILLYLQSTHNLFEKSCNRIHFI